VDDADYSVPSFFQSLTFLRAYGADDEVPRDLDPVLSLGHSNQSLLGHF
jgi:hypothetical protein